MQPTSVTPSMLTPGDEKLLRLAIALSARARNAGNQPQDEARRVFTIENPASSDSA